MDMTDRPVLSYFTWKVKKKNQQTVCSIDNYTPSKEYFMKQVLKNKETCFQSVINVFTGKKNIYQAPIHCANFIFLFARGTIL